MTKSEFLTALEQQLRGEVGEQVVRQNLDYYSSYIDSAIREGKQEREVLEELGSPLLIAKTIIDTQIPEETYGATEETAYGGQEESYHQWTLDHKRAKWLLIGGVILAVLLLFTVLRLLLPILVPVILVVVLLNLFRKR